MKNYSAILLAAAALLAGCASKQGDAAPAVQQVDIVVDLTSPGSYVADVVMTRDYNGGQGPEAQVAKLAQHGAGHYTFTDYAPRAGYTYAAQLRIYPTGPTPTTSTGASLRGTITVDGNTRATTLLTTSMPTTSGNVREAAMTVKL